MLHAKVIIVVGMYGICGKIFSSPKHKTMIISTKAFLFLKMSGGFIFFGSCRKYSKKYSYRHDVHDP